MSDVRIGILFIAVCSLWGGSAFGADGAPLLDRGIAEYRAGDFASAVKDLDAAAQAYLSPDQMQNYVNTGQIVSLDKLEIALVYLALAHDRLGAEAQARDAILRLLTAERIAPTFATLALPTDAAAIEPLAARLVPESSLRLGSAPVQIATATPPAQPKPMPPPTPASQTATSIQTPPPVRIQPPAAPPAAASAPVTPPVATAPAAPTPSDDTSKREAELAAQLARERADRERMIEERLAQERAKIEREAAARIAAAERSAQEQIVAAERSIEERVAAERASQQAPLPPIVGRRAWLTALREAYAFAAAGQLRQANAIYNRMANDENVPRDVLAEAAIGLYQTAAYNDAVRAFERLGTFARGDEDLRYYNAVSLYETGRYADARHELACALPFIEITDHVTRYRAKIEAAAR